VRTFTLVYLAAGFAIGIGLFGWAAVSSVRRHGFRRTLSGTRKFFREELPLYPKVPIAAWLGIIAFPALTIWATVTDGCSCSGSGASPSSGGTSRRSRGGNNATV
jgi:hypothetical protein